jgi:hypothetical protein
MYQFIYKIISFCRLYFFIPQSTFEHIKHFTNWSHSIRVHDSTHIRLKDITKIDGLHFELTFIFDILMILCDIQWETSIYFDCNLAVSYIGDMYGTSTSSQNKHAATNFEFLHPVCLLASHSFQTDISGPTCSYFMSSASINTSVRFFQKPSHMSVQTKLRLHSVTLVRERTIPTEQPPLFAKLVPTFSDRGRRVVSTQDSHGRQSRFSTPEQVCSNWQYINSASTMLRHKLHD